MDVVQYLRFVFALGFVLGLIGLAFYLARRYGLGYGVQRGLHARVKRRLGIVEVLPLDGKRRAVLIRRDDREHLVLIGGERDCVIENDIPVAPSDPADDTPDGPPPDATTRSATFAGNLARLPQKFRSRPPS
ncbi:MAG: FliO/MopB family protein [Magnetovibrionaceae bacterium]